MGKSTINGPFSMAMLNNQRVYIHIYKCNRLESNVIFMFITQHHWVKSKLFLIQVVLSIVSCEQILVLNT